MVQERKAKKKKKKKKIPILPDSNEKQDNLLLIQLNPPTAPPLPSYGGPTVFCHQHVSHNPRLGILSPWRVKK